VACSLADIVRHFKLRHKDWNEFPKKVAIQLNDTHPAIAVAELMRIFVDEEGLDWERAFALVQETLGYTNHTLMPEALERWPVPMFEKVLPRHLLLIYEINHHFLRKVHTRWPADVQRMRDMSIIEEGDVKQVRMAHLATVGSHSINGVAALHSELVKRELLANFYELFPERFNNKTNGVTPRRWLMYANPKLAALACELLGRRSLGHDLTVLKGLGWFADDAKVLERLSFIKQSNKRALAKLVEERCQITLDPRSMFVIHVKRIHEYKRQLLACLGIIAQYLRLKDDPSREIVPRSYLFAGKAAAGYATAKLHIRFINDIAAVINSDPEVRGRLKLAFIPNYGVSLAQTIIPAADISLQISQAGKEASGTSNMKFALNGALTLGTLDGANVEIREQVGAENFLLFGLTVEEVRALQRRGYQPSEFIARSPELKRVIDLIDTDFFCLGDPERYKSIAWYLREPDPFMVCADFDAYVAKEQEAAEWYTDRERFARASLHNIAGSGAFSSDATIAAYAREIWGVEPVKADLTLVGPDR
jgi:starch phosphorylase